MNTKKKKENKIPVMSFFTGGGFLDIGFMTAGFNVVWTNESNNAFADMYEYGISKLFKIAEEKAPRVSDRRSICDISARSALRKAFPKGKPPVFGIIGGPPCPDFSNGGTHGGHKGDHGRLTKVFVEKICSIKPSFFVLENVPGLFLKIKHRKFLSRMEKQLQKAGYQIDKKLLNVLDLGLAQDRDRLIVIGIRIDLLKSSDKESQTNGAHWFPWPEITKYRNAKKRFGWPTVVNKGDHPRPKKSIPRELMVIHLLNGKNPPGKLPNGREGFTPYSKKFSKRLEGDTSGKSFKRLHRYRYSPTACYGNNEVHVHPWKNRRLTVREVMRIQGVPDAYSLPEQAPLSYKYKLVANGVPVPLSRNIALKLRKFIKEKLK